jgi:hypothetical protein
MKNVDFILTLYQSPRTVFRLADVAMLVPSVDAKYMSNRLNYYVKTGRLYKVRKGIFVKPNYNPLELATMLYTPAYVSLQFVLQQAGVLFQYDTRYTCISYLSRELQINSHTFNYRRLKTEILLHQSGILQLAAGYSIATPERAFLDLLYLNKDYPIDNLHSLDKQSVFATLPIYQNSALEKRVFKLLDNDKHQ